MYEPAHPIGQLTSAELGAYHHRLERDLEIATTANAAMVIDLADRLAEVRAEEQSRASIREAITPDEIDARLQHYSA